MIPPPETDPTLQVQIDLVPGSPFGTVTLPENFDPRALSSVRERIGSSYELMSIEEYWVRRGPETVLGIKRVVAAQKAGRRLTQSQQEQERSPAGGVGKSGTIRADVLWYTTQEAAEYTRLTLNTLRKYRCLGTGPVYHKIGSKVLYKLSDLNDFVSKGRVV